MSKITCRAVNCGYNCSGICNKSHIDVEGLFAKSSIGTFCQTFNNPRGNISKEYEMAREFCENPVTMVSCSANYCMYNKDNYCEKNDIKIGASNAQYKSETECESFRLK